MEPSGKVSTVRFAAPPPAGTSASNCVERTLRTIRVMPFEGQPATLTLHVDVREPPPPPPTVAAITDAGTAQPRLPPVEIQKIVRAAFPQFKHCYEDGLRRDRDLRGRVAVRFVIGRDGTTTAVAIPEWDLPDATVRACLRRFFATLRYPVPDGGIVTVTYPIQFSPGD